MTGSRHVDDAEITVQLRRRAADARLHEGRRDQILAVVTMAVSQSQPTRLPRRSLVPLAAAIGVLAIVGALVVGTLPLGPAGPPPPEPSAPTPPAAAITTSDVLSADDLGALIRAHREQSLAPQSVIADVILDPGRRPPASTSTCSASTSSSRSSPRTIPTSACARSWRRRRSKGSPCGGRCASTTTPARSACWPASNRRTSSSSPVRRSARSSRRGFRRSRGCWRSGSTGGIECPAPPAPTAPPDVAIRTCPDGSYLTDVPFVPTEISWPRGGLQLQYGAYERFAAQPERRGIFWTEPRLGVYLLRLVEWAQPDCTLDECRAWMMIARLAP